MKLVKRDVNAGEVEAIELPYINGYPDPWEDLKIRSPIYIYIYICTPVITGCKGIYFLDPFGGLGNGRCAD